MISQGTTLNEKLKDHCGGASKERGGQHDTDLVDVVVGEGKSGDGDRSEGEGEGEGEAKEEPRIRGEIELN